jgi:hypothetical protein
MPFERSTWPLLYECDTEAWLILMPESAQKSLNSLTVNWVLLSVVMLLGTPNLYMISLINSTAMSDVMEAVGFTSIYFVNLSTTMKMCVNPPAFLKGPTKSSPLVEKGEVIGMVCSWWDDTCFWWVKNRQPSHRWTKESMSDTTVGQKNPCLYALPTRDLAPVWLPQIPMWISCSIVHPSSSVMHFITVSLAAL